MACLAGRTHRLADDHMTTSLEAEPSGMMRDLFALIPSSCTGTAFPFRTIGHDSFAFSRKLLDHRFSAQNLLLYRVISLPLREKLTCLWQCLLFPFYPSNSYHKPLEKNDFMLLRGDTTNEVFYSIFHSPVSEEGIIFWEKILKVFWSYQYKAALQV